MELFNYLFDNQDNSYKLSRNKVDKKFDEFIRESFANYLSNSAIFNSYAKIYDNETNFSKECSDLYILSEELYQNTIKKIKVPLQLKSKSKNLYIFNLKDIHNNDFIFKTEGNNRVFKPKKQRYLCQVISIIFVKLYILIKGIHITFNNDLTYKKLKLKEPIEDTHNELHEYTKTDTPHEYDKSNQHDKSNEVVYEKNYHDNIDTKSNEYDKSNQDDKSNQYDKSNEVVNETNNYDNVYTKSNEDNHHDNVDEKSKKLQNGGGLFDEFLKYIPGYSNNQENDDIHVDDDFLYDQDETVQDKQQESQQIEEEKEEKEEKEDNNYIKYKNIFSTFINPLIKSEINTNEHLVNIEHNLPADLEEYVGILKKNQIFDILCNIDNIKDNLNNQNILFSPNNMKKIYDSKLVSKEIQKLEKESSNINNDKLNKKYEELEKILNEFHRKYYNKNNHQLSLCSKLTGKNIKVTDNTRIYQRVLQSTKDIYYNYTLNRNKLYKDIIVNIFEFKSKNISDDDGNVITKNVITRIKDTITYSEINKLTVNAKIIIYELHIDFFNKLFNIFDLLNEGNVITNQDPNMKTNRETNPKSYRETDRETNPEPYRETDRETNPESYRETDRETNPESNPKTNSDTNTY